MRSLLRDFGATLERADLGRIGLYVGVSLAGAVAAGLAAVSLVPLVQSAATLRVAGVQLALPGGLPAQVALFALASGVFALSRWYAARLAAQLSSAYALALRRRVHAALLDAPLSALADASSAEIANVLTYNVEIATQGFSALLQLAVAAITALVSLVLALLIAPALVFAVPLLAVLGWWGARSSSGRTQARISRAYVADMTQLFWLSEDFPRRLRHVRSFQREPSERAAYAQMSARLADGYAQQQALVADSRLLLEVGAAAAIVAILVLANLWQGGERAALIAVSLLLGRLLPYLVTTRQSVQQLSAAWPALQLWQRHVALAAPPSPRDPAPPPLPAPVRIQRLVLGAPLSALQIPPITLAPGTITLIVGASGVGKSSLMDVLSGQVAPVALSATLAGRPLDASDYARLVGGCGYLGQGVRPWQHRVRDCLAWAAPEASPARMWAVLDDVGLGARLRSDGAGLDTTLNGSEGRLSGGELQRLLLAQVLLRRPPLALLDEATSALDAASEQQVLQVLRLRLPLTALVVVSHRTSLAGIADQTVTLAVASPSARRANVAE
nr:ABC transporter ATP-binding protein [Xanthomonas maliensis]